MPARVSLALVVDELHAEDVAKLFSPTPQSLFERCLPTKRPVCLIGCANSGKSTLINNLLKRTSGNPPVRLLLGAYPSACLKHISCFQGVCLRQPELVALVQFCHTLPLSSLTALSQATVSAWPGTTLTRMTYNLSKYANYPYLERAAEKETLPAKAVRLYDTPGAIKP